MTRARREKVDLSRTCYYHCFSRCVRQSYLCGVDTETGRDYSHRKAWIVSRIKQVAEAYAIGICAYAVMSNHYHVVLEVKPALAGSWDAATVLAQWSKLYPKDAKRIEALKPMSTVLYTQQVEKIRGYLTDLSWFMKSINEWIAKLSNQDEDKKGRFWEGRFGSQALLDEGAVLSAMAYVDLNPIRANICKTPEASDYTSIQARIKAYATEQAQPKELVPLQSNSTTSIAYSLEDYLALIEASGRCLIAGKGHIPEQLPKLLDRLNLQAEGWLTLMQQLETSFAYAVGAEEALSNFSLTRRYLKGRRLAKLIYTPQALAA